MAFPQVSGQTSAWGCGLSGSEITYHRLASNRLTSHFFIQDHVKAAFVPLPWLDPWSASPNGGLPVDCQ